tara:strand:- start:62 stop:1363 length:1302 start_codon:yes stop_codon:yes gene_type:complete
MPKKFKLLNPESIKYYKFTKPKKGEGDWSNSLYSRVGTQGDWTDEGGYSMKGTLLKLGYGQASADKQSMTWRDTRLAKLNNDYITIIPKKNKGGCDIGRKGEEKGGCKIGKKKKKLVLRKKDPIPTDNRQGLELMKIPYIGGGVQARPEQLLGQMDLSLFGMLDSSRTAREEQREPSVIGGSDAEDEDDDATMREELSGIGEGDDGGYDEGEVIPATGGDLSVRDFIHITQNFTQIVKDEPSGLTIAYGNEDDFDTERNEGRYDDLMKEFREEHPGDDEYPEEYDWNTEHTYDKQFFTERKREDFPELLDKMNREKQRVFRANPEFAEYFNKVEAEHGKNIKKEWDEDMEWYDSTPFTKKENVSQDFADDNSWSWGGLSGGDSGNREDMYFYDEDSMDSYFNDWKDYLGELVQHHLEKKQYLTIREETMEEVD